MGPLTPAHRFPATCNFITDFSSVKYSISTVSNSVFRLTHNFTLVNAGSTYSLASSDFNFFGFTTSSVEFWSQNSSIAPENPLITIFSYLSIIHLVR